MEELNDNTVAAIWLKLGARGRRPMLIGGIYREHRYIYTQDDSVSSTDQQQFLRWTKFVGK